MARLRLNQEYRSKIANRMRVHLEQEHTQEKEKFFVLRENMKPLQDETWKLAEQIVSRHYTPEDIKMAYHLQNKFENVDTIAKDSCFHFGYQGQQEDRDDNDNVVMKDKYIESHFDFKLNGNINGQESARQNDFAYAMYRDELKNREGCNPDINIEQKIMLQIHIGQSLKTPMKNILDLVIEVVVITIHHFLQIGIMIMFLI